MHWALAIGLAAERLKGNDSFYWPYIQSIPAECSNLWCENDMDALRTIPYAVGKLSFHNDNSDII